MPDEPSNWRNLRRAGAEIGPKLLRRSGRVLPGRIRLQPLLRHRRRRRAAEGDRVDGADDPLLHGEILVDGEMSDTHSADVDILQRAMELAALADLGARAV